MQCVPNVAIGHEPGDVYLRLQFTRCDRSFDAYVYTDEAGVRVDQRWVAFELPDYGRDPTTLSAAFVEFLRLCLEGQDVSFALSVARRYRAPS